jgi:hypothetical protein
MASKSFAGASPPQVANDTGGTVDGPDPAEFLSSKDAPMFASPEGYSQGEIQYIAFRSRDC